jgi:hypothetical protein
MENQKDHSLSDNDLIQYLLNEDEYDNNLVFENLYHKYLLEKEKNCANVRNFLVKSIETQKNLQFSMNKDNLLIDQTPKQTKIAKVSEFFIFE